MLINKICLYFTNYTLIGHLCPPPSPGTDDVIYRKIVILLPLCTINIELLRELRLVFFIIAFEMHGCIDSMLWDCLTNANALWPANSFIYLK